MPENMELGLTVNGVYYPIPISLKQLTDDGWKISGQTPYFLEPFVGEEYYETRADWSLSKDGQEILPGAYFLSHLLISFKQSHFRAAFCRRNGRHEPGGAASHYHYLFHPFLLITVPDLRLPFSAGT